MIDYGVGIIGAGHYLPGNVQSNEELCVNIADINPEWILEKTGIKRRHVISEGQQASDMALVAAMNAINRATIQPEAIGLIIIASFSQDYLFPPMSAKLHKDLGLSKTCQVIDINTNCTGLVTATTVAAERMMADNDIRYALVIGVEVLSRFTNKMDKDTAVFFSDGASAVVLGQVPKGVGLLKSKFMTDSSTYESVRMRAGGSSFPASCAGLNGGNGAMFIEQNGLATWKQAVTNLPVVLNSVVKSCGLSVADIDFFVFHQANSNLISYILKKLKIPENRTFNNVEEIGNTGSASIGIALSEAYEKGLVKPASYLLLAGVGAGFNFGANVWKV